MPWNEVSAVDLRREFVTLAKRDDVNIRWLCQRFEISAKTGAWSVLPKAALKRWQIAPAALGRVRAKPTRHWSKPCSTCAQHTRRGEGVSWQGD